MNPLIRDVFFNPALSLIPAVDIFRDDLGLSDFEFVELGLRRINTFHPSGRAFLQSVRQCEVTEVSLKAYFGASSSRRRMAMLHELNAALAQTVLPKLDRFAAFPELDGRDILALDGHDVQHGTHEPPTATASGRRVVPGSVLPKPQV
jgi:hypothetical protein